MHTTHSARRRLAIATAASLMAALWLPQTSPAPAAFAAASPTYTLTADQTAVSAADIAAGAVTVHITMSIQNDPGTASILATFDLPEGFIMSSGNYCDPYCYGNGSPTSAGSQTTFNVGKQKLLWYSGQNGGVKNDILYDTSLPFAEFDVRIPKGTAAGMYEIDFLNEDLVVGTNPETGVPITTPTCSSYSVVGTEIIGQTVNYVGCSIAVGDVVRKGDVNDNGMVNSDDAVLVLKEYAAGLLNSSILTESQKKAADVDENEKITSMDAVYILRYAAKSMLGSADWDSILNA